MRISLTISRRPFDEQYGWVAFLDMEVVVHLPHLKGSHARLLVEPVYATQRLRSDSESNSSTIPNKGSLII